METIQGIIHEKKVYHGDTDGKAWTRTAFVINGKKFSTFNDLGFDEGDKVNISYEVKGQYNNVRSGVLLEKGTLEVKEEMVVRQKDYSEGPEFGLCCNLSLRKSLMETSRDGNQEDFEAVYRKNVQFFHRVNKELRKELT